MFLEAIDLKFVHEFDQLNVMLHCSAVPFLTNGEWSEISQLIVWEPIQLPVTPSLLQVPNVMYAAWSTPDKEFQMAHFGKEFLAGRELAEYCIWHAGLVEEEAREWDTFLAGLTPQDPLISKLKAFRFAKEPPPVTNEKTQSWAETPRKLLVAALRR